MNFTDTFLDVNKGLKLVQRSRRNKLETMVEHVFLFIRNHCCAQIKQNPLNLPSFFSGPSSPLLGLLPFGSFFRSGPSFWVYYPFYILWPPGKKNIGVGIAIILTSSTRNSVSWRVSMLWPLCVSIVITRRIV